MKKIILLTILTLFISCEEKEPETIDAETVKNEVISSIEKSDPIELLNQYLNEKKTEITKIKIWINTISENAKKNNNREKDELISKGMYDAFFRNHLDKVKGGDKIFNYERDLDPSKIELTGKQKNISVKEVNLSIEKSAIKVFGINLDPKTVVKSSKLEEKTGIKDKGYYGPYIVVRIKYEILSKHYYAPNENDVSAKLIIGSSTKKREFNFKPILEGSNINDILLLDPSKKIRTLELFLPVSTYDEWNDREKRYLDILLKLIPMINYVESDDNDIFKLELNPYENTQFDSNGRRKK
jgi:hypothetical protein